MTGVCNLRKNFFTWIKAGAVIGFVMAAVLATMILAVSNSAQSAQVKTYRSERLDQKAIERQLPWGGSHLAPAVLRGGHLLLARPDEVIE